MTLRHLSSNWNDGHGNTVKLDQLNFIVSDGQRFTNARATKGRRNEPSL